MATVIRWSRIRDILSRILLIALLAILFISYTSPSVRTQYVLAGLWIVQGMLYGHMLIEKRRMQQSSRIFLIAMVVAFAASLLSLVTGVIVQERQSRPVPAVEQAPIRTLYT